MNKNSKMKKQYAVPEAQVILLKNQDVLNASLTDAYDYDDFDPSWDWDRRWTKWLRLKEICLLRF